MESATTLDDGVGLNVGWLSIPVKYVNDRKIGMPFLCKLADYGRYVDDCGRSMSLCFLFMLLQGI